MCEYFYLSQCFSLDNTVIDAFVWRFCAALEQNTYALRGENCDIRVG